MVKEREIAPHSPVFDKSGRKDGSFERANFTCDVVDDLYIRPSGKELRQCRRAYALPREARPDEDGMLRYRASTLDCGIEVTMLPQRAFAQADTLGL